MRARILRDARIKFVGIALSKLLMLGFLFYLARYYGVAYFGKFTFAFAYASLWAILMDLGISLVVLREYSVSLQNGDRVLGPVLVLRFGTVAVGLAGLILGVKLMDLAADTAALVILMGCGTALDVYARLAAGIFRAREDLSGDALVLVIQKAVFVGLAVGLLTLGGDWLLVGWSFIFGYLCVLVWSWFALGKRHNVHPRLCWDPGRMRSILKIAYPLALVDFFTLVYFRIDTVMLEVMKGEIYVGLYNAAYRLIEAAMIFPMAFLAAAFAGFARNWETDRPSLLSDYRRSMEWMMAIAAPGVAVSWVMAPEIISLFFGKDFAPAAPNLQVLLVALLAIYPNYVLTQILIASQQQKAYARYVAVCAAFNVGLNFLLIPKMADLGAATATVATELLLMILCLRRVRRSVGSIPLKKIVNLVYLSTLLGVVTWAMRQVSPILGWLAAGIGVLAIVHYGIGLRRLIFGSGTDENRD